MRVENHPILGKLEGKKEIVFYYNGRECRALEGDTVLSALLANGIRITRYTAKTHSPRGLFCGIGRCTDCVMEVDGEKNVRTCITGVREGMVVAAPTGGEHGDA